MNNKIVNVEVMEILKKIKEILKYNNMQVPAEKEEEVDFEIINAINSVLSAEDKIDVLEFFSSKGSEKAKKVLYTLAFKYAALYNDNVELFQELLDSNFNVGDSEYALNLGVLDRRISERFDKDNYIKLVKEQVESFRRFYEILSYKTKVLPNDFYIDKFTDIMNKALKLDGGNKDPITPFEGLNSFEILSVLNYFSKESILSATDEQRKTIFSPFRHYCDEMPIEDIIKLNNDECLSIGCYRHYINTFLNKIKGMLKINNVFLENENIADFKISKIIYSRFLCDGTKNEIIKRVENFFSRENGNRYDSIRELTLMYVALSNDNVEIFNELLNREFDFGTYAMNLGVLDRRLSEKFDKDDYIRLVMDENETFRMFYKILSSPKKTKEDKYYIDKFTKAMKSSLLLATNNEEVVSIFDGLSADDILCILNYFKDEKISEFNCKIRKNKHVDSYPKKYKKDKRI